MARRRIFAAALSIALLAGAFVAPRAEAAPFDPLTVTYIVPTKQGKVYLEVVHPARGEKIVPGPVILTYSPYSVLGRNGDIAEGERFEGFVEKGYVRAQADVVGTGNSGGCWDYGGNAEKKSAHDLVEWIAKQKWSNGKVAMIGGSYEGTTATAAAVTRPKGLVTIVPEAAISRWYGYAFSEGVRYSYTNEWLGNESTSALDDEGFDTPLAFDFGLAIPPPLDPQNADWAERVQSTITPCDEVAHTEHGYDDTPDYDAFWKERDYLRDAGKVTIPVLVAHNWGDWNVKQDEGWNLFHALKRSRQRVMFFGSRWEDHGSPAHERYNMTVRDWMDRHLMGKDNGIDKLPSVISHSADDDGPAKLLTGAPKTKNVELIAQMAPVVMPGMYPWQLLPSKPSTIFFGQSADEAAASFPITNANIESHAGHHGQANHEWFWLESPPFKKDMRIFGDIKIQLYSTIQREWITFTPSIYDVDPADHQTAPVVGHASTNPNAVVAITRGFQDTRYRNGLAKQVPVKPGKKFETTVEAHPIDYVIKKGHYLGLNIQTEIIEWMVPKPYPGCDAVPDPNNESGCTYVKINWQEGRTRLIVPIVNPPKNTASMFNFKHDHGEEDKIYCVNPDVCIPPAPYQ